MAADKHLVLDEDVHRKLKQRKRDTGLTVREIGNSVLRSVLWRQSLSELIGRKLVESGALSAEEYTRIREAALNEAANELYTTEKAIELTEKGTGGHRGRVLHSNTKISALLTEQRDQTFPPILDVLML